MPKFLHNVANICYARVLDIQIHITTCYYSTIYIIVKNIGGKKVWQIRTVEILAEKTLAN